MLLARNFRIFVMLCLAFALHPQLAVAQVVVGTPTRAIGTVNAGYCFTDTNTNGAIELGEIGVTASTEAMTSNTIPPRDAVTTGGRTFTPSEIHIADNWTNITTQGNYVINIEGICIGGVSRTDNVSTQYDDNDPADGVADRTEQTTRSETSPAGNYFDDNGFTFVGGTVSNEQVISFRGQVRGNVGATANQSNIQLTFDANSEIDGLLDLGNANAISNAVLNLAGQIDEVDLDNASNFTLTSSATIGDSATSGTGYSSATIGNLGLNSVADAIINLSGTIATVDMASANNVTLTNSATINTLSATNVSNGLQLTNTGTVTVLDLTGSSEVTVNLNTGSSIGTLRAHDITNPTSSIDNDGTIERLEITNSSGSAKVDLAIINDGSISANTNAALVINDTDAGGGEIDVAITNAGTISAATSNALDFSGLDGGRLDITNSGSVSTNASGTNNAINGAGAEGLVFLNNSGSVTNAANRAVNLQNLVGYFRLVNSGAVTSNQIALDLTGASGSTASVIDIHNGFNLNANNAIVAAGSGTREIKTTGSNAILLDGASGNISITNGAGASIIAENTLAIAASGVTGNITLSNAGNIRAFRATPGLSNERAIDMDTTGNISFTSTAGTIDARDRSVDLISTGGKITFSNAGTIASTQTVNDADATATDNYTVRLERVGGSDDESSITNTGTISSTTDHALLLQGIACDADAASTAYCLNNSGTMSAGRQFALAGAAISDLKFNNSGTVTAFDQSVNLTDLSGTIVVDNAGTISATQAFSGLYPDPDATKYGMRLVKESGQDATLAFTNRASGVISTLSNNALRIVDFDGANDNVTFTNGGDITATGNNAVDFSNSNVSSITNQAGATISAGGNYAILMDGLAAASMTLSNLGTITAGASSVGAAPAAIHGALAAGVTAITITNGASAVISSVGNTLANANANSGGTIFIDADVATFELTNSGTILAGAEATASASAVKGNNAIRVTDIGANAVSVTNAATGSIKALGDTAIYVKGDSGNITSFSLTNSGTISAENATVSLEEIVGASAVIANTGTISASAASATSLLGFTNVSADFSLTNSGTIETAGTRAVYVDMNNTSLGTDDMVAVNNQTGGIISADSETVTFLDVNEQVNFDNSGIIRATAGASAVAFFGIGNHQVDFDNNATGVISASGNTAVALADFEGTLNFTNGAGAGISAANTTVVLSPTTNNARLNFSNAGLISASASTANHVLRFVGFGGALSIQNLATGTISSAGSNALYADHTVATPSLDFDNLGNIKSASGDAVVMSGFTDAVSVVNGGTIEVTAGNNALQVWGGDTTSFTNSGRIEASGDRAVYFTNFAVNAATVAPSFTNSATGIIRAASAAFATNVTGATSQIYTLSNAGSIIADNGAYAVDMSGAKVQMTSSGAISATASPAIRTGAESTLNISGTVSAGGALPVAIALEGRGSVVNLSDGATLIGDIAPLDTGTDYTPAQKHRVNLSGVSNASYYYEFPTAQFRFFVDGTEMENGNGFSAATSNLQAMPLIHAHHAQGTRNIWRQLGRMGGAGGMRSFAFSDELENEKRSDRFFTLDGDRHGLAHSFRQSIFDWFEAELILVANETAFELDGTAFTIDKSYQGVGLGFSDVLQWGPVSFSAMVLTGIGQTDMKRLVFSNTVSTGRFNLSSSYDAVYLDTVYEALFNRRVWGREGKLTRRNPYRINLEVGLGGTLHSESNDGYKERTYVTASDSDMQSSSVGGRLKVEVEARNPYGRNNLRGFIEFEQNIFETGSGTDFDYNVQGTAQNIDVDVEDITQKTLAIGADYEISRDMTFSLNYAALSGDKDSDETALTAALKWRF